MNFNPVHFKRISSLQKILKTDYAIISNPKDLFYLTGLDVSSGLLLISRAGVWIGLDGRYYSYAQPLLQGNIILCERGNYSALFEAAKIARDSDCSFDSQVEPYGRYQELLLLWKNIGGRALIPTDSITSELRILKDDEELRSITKAAHISDEGFEFVLSILKKGISEKEVAARLQAFWLETYGSQAAFDPIIAFGSNSAYPHAIPTDRKLNAGDIVLVDIGATFEHYHADMTRMVYFGEPDPRMEVICNHVMTAHEKAFHEAKIGVEIAQLDKTVRSVFSSVGYEEAFCHSLGHGIGLSVHEKPIIRTTSEGLLQERMVITIEPGLYLPEIGGARLENTYYLGAHGLENLMNSPLTPTYIPI